MKPPKGAGERVYPHGRMGTGTDLTAKLLDRESTASRRAGEAIPKVFTVPRFGTVVRVVEPNSIDSADLAARDRPSAAEAHAADLTELLERANASNARMAKSLARHEAERREWAAKLAEAQRPRQHGLVSSLLTLLRGDR